MKINEFIKETKLLEQYEIEDVLNIIDLGFNCYEIKTPLFEFIIGSYNNLEDYYVNSSKPSKIFDLPERFLENELDYIDKELFVYNDGNDEFAKSILGNKDFHQILKNACKEYGISYVLHCEIIDEVNGLCILRKI